ncbi:hypothetical protein PPYR_07446 [Photinus pyralis]|uniref:Uncharacterized protein n=1 Tax=Photinus pyralis TaxID=7054 RepID=A0A5N4ANQ3_PHOPY|nr:hypothetical protein PPYR_06855 [Photinus pyralis]KAB0799566.1 hypothetical protein PPYR_07446 [Photinus pyralis]
MNEVAPNAINSATGGPPVNPLIGANIVKEGWLYKRGERIKNWRPSHCVEMFKRILTVVTLEILEKCSEKCGEELESRLP